MFKCVNIADLEDRLNRLEADGWTAQLFSQPGFRFTVTASKRVRVKE